MQRDYTYIVAVILQEITIVVAYHAMLIVTNQERKVISFPSVKNLNAICFIVNRFIKRQRQLNSL